MLILLLADNLTTGGARLAEEVINSWNLDEELIVIHSNNLTISDDLSKNVRLELVSKSNPIFLLFKRLKIARIYSPRFILNFTNFPLPIRLLHREEQLKINEILLIQNLFLVSWPEYFHKMPQKIRFLPDFLRALFFIFTTFFSNPKCVVVQTNLAKQCAIKRIPWYKNKLWYVTKPILKQENIDNIHLDNKKIKNTWFYPSAFYPHKNHSALINIAKKIKENSLDTQIVVTLDSRNKYVTNFLDIINEKNLDDVIVNVGWLTYNESNFYMQNCKGLLFLSHFETLGLPLLEAYSQQKPIIAAESKTSRELVSDYAQFVNIFESGYDEKIISLMKNVNQWFLPNKDKIKFYSENSYIGEYVIEPIELCRLTFDKEKK